MEIKEIIKNLKEKLIKRYNVFNKEFLYIDSEENFINIYCYSYIEDYLNKRTLNSIINFVNDYLFKNGYKDYFYILDYAFKINEIGFYKNGVLK